MKKLAISFLSLILFSNNNYAQCKLKKTSDGYLQTKTVTIADVVYFDSKNVSWNLDFDLIKAEGNFLFNLTHQAEGKRAYGVQQIEFRLKDNNKILKNQALNVSQEGALLGGYTQRFTLFNFTKEEMELLKEKDILEIKIEFSDFSPAEKMFELKRKDAEKIKEFVKCILISE